MNTPLDTSRARWRTLVLAGAALLGSATLGATLAAHGSASAGDGDPRTESIDRAIPYRGSIAHDGAPISGQVEMRFTLVDDTGTALWSDEWSASSANGPVNVYAGEFKVVFGTGAPLGNVVVDAEALLVRVEVHDGSAWQALSGEQALGTVPDSIWMATGSALDVGGSVRVGNAVPADEARIDVAQPSDRPAARFGQLTLDSATGSLGEVSAGAAWDPAAGQWRYTSDRGATRLTFDDDTYAFQVHTSTTIPPNVTPGAVVSWNTPLVVETNGHIGIDASNPTGTSIGGSLAADSVDVSSTLSATDATLGTLDLDAPFLQGGSKPFVFREMSFDTAATKDTGIAVADAFCWIGGWTQATSTSTGITGLAVETKPGSGGTWLINYDQYDAVGEDSRVYYMCVDRGWVQGLESEPLCGNVVCEFGEQASWCPSDCGGACGDGTCAVGEATSCVADCGWTL